MMMELQLSIYLYLHVFENVQVLGCYQNDVIKLIKGCGTGSMVKCL